MDEKLKQFEEVWAVLNRSTVTEDDFVASFKEVMEFIKASNNATAEVIQEVFNRLDTFAQQLKGDTEDDRKLVKQAVGQALAELRTTLDARIAEVKDGYSPIKGVDYFDGKDADEATIVATVLSKVPPPLLPIPETPDEIVSKVNKSTLLIAKERIAGLVDLMSNIAAQTVSAVGVTTTNFFKNGTLIGRAKNINIIEGNNITATLYQTGDQMNINITSTASGSGNFATEEIPTGTIDSANVTFTLAHTPIAGSQKLFLNGARQQSGGADYSISGATITFITAPQSGSILLCDYQY